MTAQLHCLTSSVARHTMRRLSRMRSSTLLALFLLVSLLLTVLFVRLSILLVLHPTAVLLFRFLHLSAATDVAPSSALPANSATFVIGATLPNLTQLHQLRVRHLHYDVLPLHRPEVDLILSYLKPSHVYLEFGISPTTLSFPYFVHRSFAVHHDPAVCAAFSQRLLDHPDLHPKLRVLCPDTRSAKHSSLLEGSYHDFKSYIDLPRTNLSSTRFDRVLINGPARVAAALRILPQLSSNSLVFFHDFFKRPAHYAEVLRYYDEVARVLSEGAVSSGSSSDSSMGVMVLRPKASLQNTRPPSLHVSERELDAIYAQFEDTPPSAASSGPDFAFETRVLRTDQGAFPHTQMRRELSRKTSIARLVLDVMVLPLVLAAHRVIQWMFQRVFLQAVSGSSGMGSAYSAKASINSAKAK